MVDMLVWVIGGNGVPDPMAGFEDVSENPSLHGFSSWSQSMSKLDI